MKPPVTDRLTGFMTLTAEGEWNPMDEVSGNPYKKLDIIYYFLRFEVLLKYFRE